MAEVVVAPRRSDCTNRSSIRSAPARWVPAGLIVLGGLLYGAKASAETVGPSFPCTPATLDALERLACTDPSVARADIQLVQTYYAVRRAVGPEGQKTLKSQFLSFIIGTRQTCGLPPVAPNADQSGIPLPASAASCVAPVYDQERSALASRLFGPAAEEAARAPEQNIALQSRLQALGFLPKDAVIDGVFGAGTRTALLAWQRTNGRPETGFFGDTDAAALLGGASTPSSPPDPLAEFRGKPLAKPEEYDGKPLTIGYRALQVTLDTETSQDQKICRTPKGGFLFPDASGSPQQATCNAVVAKITVDGNNVLTTSPAVLDGQTDVGSLHLQTAIRRLDPSTALPQIVFSGYSGGAHCCTSTAVATAGADGSWRIVSLGQIDGDQGYGFLDLAHDGSSELAGVADSFLYAYASYAGSFAPTRILRFTGAKIEDVTTDPLYRGFLLHDLQDMEQAEARSRQGEPNGYFAGWVAQKALVGQFEDAWRTMLTSYDRQATNGLSACAVDKRAWTKAPQSEYRSCPEGQEILIPFPQALALKMVDEGYITPEQSAAIGYDPAKIKADRAAALKAATANYEQRMTEGWFMMTREEKCALADKPASPADLVANDRSNGLEDDVNVVESDSSGKPVAVRVGEPEGNDLETVFRFYRGSERCEAARQQRQNELQNLK